MTSIRYDGLASWYDQVMRDPQQHKPLADAASRLLGQLIGPADTSAIDIGCGTGIFAATIRALGYTPVGVDLSADQLRLATASLPCIQADAGRLPFASSSWPVAYSTFITTDFDDFEAAGAEVHRILAHQGRYITIGVHPCFYGSFSEAKREGTIVQHPGYRNTTFLQTSIHGSTIRSRVGAWHRPLASLINTLVGIGFKLAKVLEDGPNDIPNLLGMSLIKS